MDKDNEHIISKGKPIPRLPGNRFLHENWWALGPIKFTGWYAEEIKRSIIGWCPASKVFDHKKEDEDCIAVMFNNNKWCHMSYSIIYDYDDELYDWFDMFNFEGLDRKFIDDWVERQKNFWK